MFGLTTINQLFGRKRQSAAASEPIIQVDPRERLATLKDWHMQRANYYRIAFEQYNDVASYSRFMHSVMAVTRIDSQLSTQPTSQQLTLF